MPNGEPPSMWTPDQLKALMDERDRRYKVVEDSQKEAVKLAKEVAESSKGKIDVVALLSLIALLLSISDKIPK